MNTEDTRIGIDFNPTIGGQDNINAKQLAADDIAFAMGKISEGIGWDVPAERTVRTLKELRGVGIAPIAYHFGWGNDPEKQVNTFIRGLGGVDFANRVGLCLDVESYNGQVPPKRQHVLGFFRELAGRCGKDRHYFCYGPHWYWDQVIDRPSDNLPQVLEVLANDGIHVIPWITPVSGYVEGPGTIRQLCSKVPQWEWDKFLSGRRPRIIQGTSEAHTTQLGPIDGNITYAERDQLARWCQQ